MVIVALVAVAAVIAAAAVAAAVVAAAVVAAAVVAAAVVAAAVVALLVLADSDTHVGVMVPILLSFTISCTPPLPSPVAVAIYDYEALAEPGEEDNLEFEEGDLIEVREWVGGWVGGWAVGMRKCRRWEI